MIKKALTLLFISAALSRSVASAQPRDTQPRDTAGLLGIRIGWALSQGASVFKLTENSNNSPLFNQIANSDYVYDGSDAGMYLFHNQSTIAARFVSDICSVGSNVPANILVQGVYPVSFETHSEPSGVAFENEIVPENPEPLEPTPTPAPITDFVGLPKFLSLNASGDTFIAAVKPITQGASLPAPGPELYNNLYQRGIITNDNLYRLAGELTVARIAATGGQDDPVLSDTDLLELSQICARKNAGQPIDPANFTTSFAKGVAYGLSSSPATPTPTSTATPQGVGPTETPDIRPPAGSDLSLVCYEGKTHELPEFLLAQYLNEFGATLGECGQVSAPTATPSSTPTLAPTQTSSATPTSTSTVTPTNTPTLIPTNTATTSPTVTSTSTPTVTPTSTRTSAPTSTSTSTPTVTPTNTPTLTPTTTPTATPTPRACLRDNFSVSLLVDWALFDWTLHKSLVAERCGKSWCTKVVGGDLPPLRCVRNSNVAPGMTPDVSFLKRKREFVCSQVTSLHWPDGGLLDSWTWSRITSVGAPWKAPTEAASLALAKSRITLGVRSRFHAIDSKFPNCWSSYRALSSIGLDPTYAWYQYKCANPSCPDYRQVGMPPSP